MKILGTVCARGGSKGVKNKNIRLLNGKPLIAYTIEAFKAWKKANRIICSTDSEEIKKVALDYGAEAPFIRPAELATDTASKLDVYKHALNFIEKEENTKYDYLVDLDATSPLRTIQDINNAFNLMLKNKADLIASAYLADRNPYFNMLEVDNDGYAHICKNPEIPIVARQLAPKVYSLNASIWVYKRDFLNNTSYHLSGRTIIYEMLETSIDIDREIDFQFIEFLLKERKYKFDF